MISGRTLCAAVLLGAAGCSHTVQAVLPNPNQPANGISVSGQGEAKGVPDLARASLGVEVRAQSAEQATADINQRMAAVIAVLKQAGIADKDLRTSNLSIGFEQEPQPHVVVMPAPAVTRGKAAPEIAPEPAPEAAPVRGHYRATNMVEATIRDLDVVGRIVKLATDAGANNVWGISFELEDPQPLRNQARAQAIERAKQSAQELARLTGVKLGKIVSMSESEGGGHMPMKSYAVESARAQGGDAPVERGEISVSHHVQLLFELQ